MSKIFKNMIPYWKSILVILVLLFVQAWCDLSLPSYTSDIIDVGIQNSGVEHVTPKRITEEEFQTAEFIMTDDEVDLWESLYTKKDGYYERNKASEKELDETDDTLTVALLMNYQMGAMEEDTFKQLMAQQTGQDASVFENMTIEQIGEMMHVELKSFQQEKEDDDGNKVEVTCVDVRPIFAAMLESGQMDKDTVLSMRDSMEKTLDTMGSSLVKSMGIAYAVSADKAAGLDVDQIQKTYLLTAGLKMVGMALLMGVVTVLVGLFASRVGAGIGRDLREKVFKRVVGFSNAEMDQFSTASLITRSTNDIQQIQMVSVMVLRMVAYAPILGIGGVLKVMKTGAGMEWIIVLAIIVILGYVMLLVSLAMPKFKLMQKLVDNINLVSREILTGLSVIRAFGREDKEEERFNGANKELTKTTLFTNRVMTFMMPGMMMIMNVLTVGIVWVGAHKIDAGTMQVGAMTAFITYAMMIVMSFLMLTMMSIMLPRAAVAAGRIDEVIQTESSIQDVKNPEQLEVHNGVVRFDHVNFRYPGAEEDVLHDIDFVAEPGKTTAIIGSTGCGKSTLVNLIPRLYDVTGGKITLDGKDIRNITMKDLRDEIAAHPGADDGIDLVRVYGIQPVGAREAHTVRHAEAQGIFHGAAERLLAQLRGVDKLSPAVQQQRNAEIAVVRADVRSARALRHKPGTAFQPRRDRQPHRPHAARQRAASCCQWARSASVSGRSTRQGFPSATTLAGMSLVTMLPAPISLQRLSTAPIPMLASGPMARAWMIAPWPMVTRREMVTTGSSPPVWMMTPSSTATSSSRTMREASARMTA